MTFCQYIDVERSKLYVGLPLKIHGMNQKFVDRIAKETEEIKAAGLYKSERIITSPQGAEIEVGGKTVLNFCANNYLGLSSHPKVIEASKGAIDSHGYGMSSVRFICGTQDIHKELEQKIARQNGFRDVTHRLEFFGVCPECKP